MLQFYSAADQMAKPSASNSGSTSCPTKLFCWAQQRWIKYVTLKYDECLRISTHVFIRPIHFVFAELQINECKSPTDSSPDPPSRRPSFTRSGSVRYQESEVSPESNDKPSGKRKFKSKHLCDNSDQKVSLLLYMGTSAS